MKEKTKKKAPLNNSTSWLKIYRKFLEWEWYDDINTKVLFLHLLLKANYKDKYWKGELIKRGTFITSLDSLYNELNRNPKTGKLNKSRNRMTPQSLRTAIKRLISTNEITKQSSSQYTVITINNYELYQGVTNEITNEQQTINKRLTTTIERVERVEGIELPKGREDKSSNYKATTLKSKKKKVVQGEYGSTNINLCTEYLKEKLGASLDGSNKENRMYCYNLLRKMKKDYPNIDPVEQVKMLIDVALQDKFHSRNVTGFKYLYYNTQRIAQSFKGDYGIGANNSDIQVI